MPKTGQIWDAQLLERSPLLQHYRPLAQTLMQAEGWPPLEAYTALAESERRTRAAELAPVRFAPAPKRARRSRERPPLDIAQLYDGRIALSAEVPCVSASYHDLLNALAWAGTAGGLVGLHARANRNAQVLFDWIERTPWVQNLGVDPATWSNTSVCLTFCDPKVLALAQADQRRFANGIAERLADEGAAYDTAAYRDAPPGLRLWTGATVEPTDITAALPWIEWAYHTQIDLAELDLAGRGD